MMLRYRVPSPGHKTYAQKTCLGVVWPYHKNESIRVCSFAGRVRYVLLREGTGIDTRSEICEQQI
jgi:hypothetical protein